jgi:mono/diheme cytochrome c family protein
MSFRPTWSLSFGSALLLAGTAAACSAARLGASDATLVQARDRAQQGSSVFAARCAGCHGERGEGKAYAPPTMGPSALPIYPRDNSAMSPTTTDPQQLQLQAQTRPPGAASRKPLKTAQDLYDYLSRHTPNDSLRSLTPADLWAVVTFMLIAHGSQVPAAGVTAENAATILI